MATQNIWRFSRKDGRTTQDVVDAFRAFNQWSEENGRQKTRLFLLRLGNEGWGDFVATFEWKDLAEWGANQDNLAAVPGFADAIAKVLGPEAPVKVESQWLASELDVG